MNFSLTRLIALVLVASALTVLPAVIHGRYTNRWGPAADQLAAAKKLGRCPETVGPWKRSGKDAEFSVGVVRELQLAGHLSRAYVNEQTGEKVTVALMVGLPGALSRHPPEICYGMRDNQRLGEPVGVEITDSEQAVHHFRMLRYREPGRMGDAFTVCYAFTVDGRWDSPKYPRIAYGGKPLLYKMQVLCGGIAPDESPPEPTRDFLTQFLPVLRDDVIGGSVVEGG